MSLLAQLTNELGLLGIGEPRLEAIVLIEHVTAIDRSKIISDDIQLTSQQQKTMTKLVARRETEPLAYLTQQKEFYGSPFYVDKCVMIPRPDSEAIVELALGLKLPQDANVLDVGCGSGCLGLAFVMEKHRIANRQPNLILIDKNAAALAVAKRNAKYHKISAKYHRAPADSIGKLEHLLPENSLILANLPYLPISDQNHYEELCPDLRAEPSIALYTTGDGLDLYRRLFDAVEGKSFYVVVESLTEQHAKMRSMARNTGYKFLESRGMAQVFGSYQFRN